MKKRSTSGELQDLIKQLTTIRKGMCGRSTD